MIEQGYFTSLFDEDKGFIAECYSAIGLNNIANDIKSETNFSLFMTYAHVIYTLLENKGLFGLTDEIVSRKILLRAYS